MRTLIVDRFAPESPYSELLAEELGKLQEVTTLERRTASPEAKGYAKKRPLYENERKFPISAFLYARDLAALRRETRGPYDAILVETFKSAKREIPIFLKAAKNGKVLAHAVHNLLPHEADPGDVELYGRFYRACSVLIAHDGVTRDRLVGEWGVPEERVTIAPHGAYAVPDPDRAKEPDETTVFTIFGMVRKYKGIDVAIRALAAMPEEERRKARLRVCGKKFEALDPTDYAGLAESLGVGNLVELDFRRIPDGELPEIFGKADFALFPYSEITTSGALLMAFSQGTPTIASDLPAFVSETEGGRTGFLFGAGNPESLAEAMRKAAESNAAERRAMVEAEREIVEERHSWKTAARLTADALERASEKKREKA